jgi:hypothetical protein
MGTLSFGAVTNKTTAKMVTTNGVISYNASWEYDSDGNISNVRMDIRISSNATMIGSASFSDAGNVTISNVDNTNAVTYIADVQAIYNQIKTIVSNAVAKAS